MDLRSLNLSWTLSHLRKVFRQRSRLRDNTNRSMCLLVRYRLLPLPQTLTSLVNSHKYIMVFL